MQNKPNLSGSVVIVEGWWSDGGGDGDIWWIDGDAGGDGSLAIIGLGGICGNWVVIFGKKSLYHCRNFWQQPKAVGGGSNWGVSCLLTAAPASKVSSSICSGYQIITIWLKMKKKWVTHFWTDFCQFLVSLGMPGCMLSACNRFLELMTMLEKLSGMIVEWVTDGSVAI